VLHQGRRQRATVAGVTIAIVASFALAAPAWAKGAESATITGPGLDKPIEIHLGGPGSEDDGVPSYVEVAFITLADPYFAGHPDVPLPSDPPTDDLGSRYRLTWLMARPHDADPADYTIEQDVYPDASGGRRPLIYTRPGRYIGAGGWYRTPEALRDTLAVMGVPVTGLETAPLDVRQPPAPAQDEEAGSTVGLRLGATLALACAAALLVVGVRRRRSVVLEPAPHDA
jgi:hypothetical protein